jgi:hypothetical protein
MPFRDPKVSKIYRDIVEPTLKEVQLEPNRADERYGADVMQDVWAGVNEARLVIADLTGRNPNVFYEVGIAHMLGKPMLLLSADGSSAIPFDLNRFRHILYDHTPVGLRDLRKNLRAALPEILRVNTTGHHLIDEVEADASLWRGPTRDTARLYSPERLNLLRDFVRPEDLSDFALAFCAASACQWALAAHMVYWGNQCSQREGAARDLAFGLFDVQRRPRLRVAHLLAQLPARAQDSVLATMAKHNLERPLRNAIAGGDVATFVRQGYRRLGLSGGERDEILALFQAVLLTRRKLRFPK